MEVTFKIATADVDEQLPRLRACVAAVDGASEHKVRTQQSGPRQHRLYAELLEGVYRGMPALEQDWSSSDSKRVQITVDDEATLERLLRQCGREPGQRLAIFSGRHSLSLWFPLREHLPRVTDHFVSREGERRLPRYPIYIPSKGRACATLSTTTRLLRAAGVPFKLVVEAVEFDLYRETHGAQHVICLPFSDLGQGSIPARNWIWEHAREAGAGRHWVVDDNMERFLRVYRNRKYSVRDCGALFAAIEDLVDRCDNVALAGMHDDKFVAIPRQPLTFNTRVYSCILVRTELPRLDGVQWRGAVNEDTDLSIRCLKAGYSTLLFNALLMKKRKTMTVRGGNTDTVYRDGRQEFADSLARQHPDVVRSGTRYGRPHHIVNYRPFRENSLGHRPEDTLGPFHDYGLELVARE